MEIYNLDDIVNMSSENAKNLLYDLVYSEVLEAVKEDNLTEEEAEELRDSYIGLDSQLYKSRDKDFYKLSLIFILKSRDLFEFGGIFKDYVFGDDDDINDDFDLENIDFLNGLSSFVQMYKLYVKLYELKDKPIKYVLIETGYVDRLLDRNPNYDPEMDVKVDIDLVSVSNQYIRYPLEYSSILDDSKDRGVIYRVNSIVSAFDKVFKLMTYDYCACFGTQSLYKIRYLPESQTLVLEYDCES